MDYSIEKTLPFEVNTSSDARKLLLFIEAIFASLPTIDKQKRKEKGSLYIIVENYRFARKGSERKRKGQGNCKAARKQ